MDRKHIPESENKLVLLLSLDALGPVTGMQLLQFLVELDLMNYFDMQINLGEMEEQGQLTHRAHPLGDLLLPTEAGHYMTASFGSRVPASRRELIESKALDWRARFRSEQQMLADSFPLREGGICLRLRLLEADSALLDLVMTLPRQASLTFLQRRWRSAAQGVYDAMATALGGGYDDDVPPAELPASATLQRMNTQDWLLTLTDHPDKPTMTLLLTLPDEHLARFYASRWPSQCDALKQLIMKELEEG